MCCFALFCLLGAEPALGAEEAGTQLFPEQASPEEEQLAEWTVLFYFSGADLESDHHMATSYITTMSLCTKPSIKAEEEVLAGSSAGAEYLKKPRNVNVLLQTGGSRSWENSGLTEISPNRLQRWRMQFGDNWQSTFALEEELPLASMADPTTLSDFIRWGTERYPAKKTALVLWGHGEGSKGGLLYDEMFGGDVMSLGELKSALAHGGEHLEAVILDACMMANLETAAAVQPHANYMIASEEVVPGEGTAVYSWLQELIFQPEADGKRLGRNICDMTAIWYEMLENEEAGRVLTWSVVDLSKIPRVTEIFEQLIRGATRSLVSDLAQVSVFMDAVLRSETYGEASDCMLDLASIFYNYTSFESLSLYWRNEMLNALTDAIVYTVHGSERNEARGLSICFGANMTPAELDRYAQNCGFPAYLAFLDALYDNWSAPEWVYAEEERPKEISEITDYTIHYRKKRNAEGIPGIAFDVQDFRYNGVNYVLYRMDESEGQLIQMGYTPCRAPQTEENEQLWCAEEFWWWPAIDGHFCEIEMISSLGYYSLYHVPLLIGDDVWYLRYGRYYDANPAPVSLGGGLKERYQSFYLVYGLWEGHDPETHTMSRNVIPLSMSAGQEYSLLFRAGLVTEEQRFVRGEGGILPRSLEIEKKLLDPGTYYLQYELLDMFDRRILFDPIEFYWDGEKAVFSDQLTWDGDAAVRWSGSESTVQP